MAYPKAVIFDFDGVMANSLDWHVKAWDSAAKELFGQRIPEPMKVQIVGKSTRGISETINAFFGDQKVSELMRLKAKHVINLSGEVPLFEESRAFCRLLTELKIPYGIASNAPRDFVRGVVVANKLNVSVVLGVEDVGSPKPAPDLFLKCAKDLGVSPFEHPKIIVFEDSLHGIEAACAAGMFAIGVISHASKQQLIQSGARHTCAHTLEIKDHELFSSF